MQEMQAWSLGHKDILGKKMATHSSILAQETPWTGILVGCSLWALQRVRYNLVTKQQQKNSFYSGCCGRHSAWVQLSVYTTRGQQRKQNLKNISDVLVSRTRRKRLSSSSSSSSVLRLEFNCAWWFEFEQAPGFGDGQGSLACWDWVHAESMRSQRRQHDWATELNWTEE